ncbi:MAG: type II toxin-antitoxin system RelE/ParE family toxin [Planctomycetota bacterium]
MNDYFLTPEAEDGLVRTMDYVERVFGLAVADEVLTHLEVAFERLGRRPGLGHRRRDLTTNPRIRFWNVGPSLIAYERSEAGITVHLVERAERNWRRLLRDRGL